MYPHLRSVAKSIGVELNREALGKLKMYEELIKKWGERVDLLSRRDIYDLEKHFIDAIFIIPHLVGGDVLDVGTGAGLPGIPIKIVAPDFKVHLLDRSKRKCIFLKAVIRELGLEGIEVLNADFFEIEGKFDSIILKATGLGDTALKRRELLREGGRFYIYANEPSYESKERIGFINPLRGHPSWILIF